MNTERKNIARSNLFIFVCFLAALGPFSTTFLNGYVVISIFFLSISTLLVLAAAREKIELSRVMTPAVVTYLLLMLVAIFAIIYSRCSLTGVYLTEVIIGRIFTLVTSVLSMFILCWWLSNASLIDIKFALKICFVTLLVFMLLGLYQFFCNLFGMSFFIETRDWMHGVPEAFKHLVPKRLTSISEEPNFLSPLIVEFLLLSFILLERKLFKFIAISLGLFILIFSFSGGAYVNFVLVVCFSAFLSFLVRSLKGKISVYDIIIFCLLCIFLAFFIYYGDVIFEFVSYKFNSESSGGSTRTIFMKSILKLFSESDFIQMFFGHGLATMSALDSFGLAKSDYLFKISNNFILDMLWESGILGVFLIMIFYFSNFIIGIKKFTKNKYFFFGLVFSFHMFIVGLYRSEYLSSHFAFMLAIVGMLYRIGYIKENISEKKFWIS